MSLDENETNVAYNLGRLFALLEKVQEEAAKPHKLNSTIANRFLNSACATPATTFPTLLKLNRAHISKLERDKKGLAVFFENQIGEILGTAVEPKIAELPKRLSLADQGLFFIGYYHQTQSRPAGKKGETHDQED